MLLPSSIRTFVFDLDNTLYDESLFVLGGTSYVIAWIANQFSINQKYLHSVMDSIMENYPRGEWYQRLLERLRIPYSEKVLSKMISIYRNHVPNLRLYKDAENFLESIRWLREKRNGIKIALISDGLIHVQESKVKALGLRKIMDECIFTWEKGSEFQKPHKWAFESIESRTGTSGKLCCYFGDDQSKDFFAPRELGWQSVCLLRGKEIKSSFDREFTPLFYVDTFEDIVLNNIYDI